MVADCDNFHPSGKQRTKFCGPLFPVCPCFSDCQCISTGLYKISLKVIHPPSTPLSPLFLGFIFFLSGKFFFNFRSNSNWHIFMTEDLLWRTSSNHRTWRSCAHFWSWFHQKLQRHLQVFIITFKYFLLLVSLHKFGFNISQIYCWNGYNFSIFFRKKNNNFSITKSVLEWFGF